MQDWLASRGLSQEEGPQPLERLLRQHVLGPAAHALLQHRMQLAQQSAHSMLGSAADGTACRVLVAVALDGEGLEVRPASLGFEG